MFDKATARHMLAVFEGDMSYIRNVVGQHPPGTVTHHHGEVDHVAYLERPFMEARDAVLEATRNRIRPIFMSTLTSIFGMLPLAIFPGAGSELYRGLGSVVIGGLALSALLTLLIVPPLLGLFAGRLEKSKARAQKGAAQAPAE